jgi:hypothetical protein
MKKHLNFCKNCKEKYIYTAKNKKNYDWCKLFDKSTGKVQEDLKILLYTWERGLYENK